MHGTAAPSALLPPDTRLPTRLDALWFAFRAAGLRVRRGLRELGRRPPRHRAGDALAASPVIAAFSSPLWPAAESDRTLVAGKIHNLRVARQRLHGLEIPAGAVFSFWRQLGRPDARAGFVAGRELREGCLVPAIGGGLCQLTNALYVAALQASLEIVERHRHSRVVPGSLAQVDRDATVFWNYLDLRLRADRPWRIEIDLDAENLTVRLRAAACASGADSPRDASGRAEPVLPAVATGDCATCERTACHRWTGPRALEARRTWVLDPASPALPVAAAVAAAADRRIVGDADLRTSPLRPLRRVAAALLRRWARARGATNAALALRERARLARDAAARLQPDDLDLVVAQGLLPFLWRDGALAGRRFAVLMDALPMDELQRRLDVAAARNPEAASLRDFRAPDTLVADERAALAAADRWISAHADVLALAGAKAQVVPWPAETTPHVAAHARRGPLRVLFPASSLARKGAFELREALRDLPVRLLLPPGAQESADFWRGIDVERVEDVAAGLAIADVVTLPAWIEHQPRALLAALAAGTPVVATAACGLAPSRAWTCVPAGDAGTLRAALVLALVGARAVPVGAA